MVAAKRGCDEGAARMIGAIDAHMTRAGTRPSLALQRLRERVLSEIANTHTSSEVEVWLAKGSTLDSDAFTRQVIESCGAPARVAIDPPHIAQAFPRGSPPGRTYRSGR